MAGECKRLARLARSWWSRLASRRYCIVVNVAVEGNEVVIRFALDGDEGMSSSGKSRIVASTHGNVLIPGTGIKVGLNAYK
jgi:hypothetical protein